ncbi:MAG: mevalonate kinase [Anaerolineae bacterium]|nr:mevalonate kinase [Anaerolineae bacterium]
MTSHTASAPGKIILFGEHAVVYGQPALAAPVHKVQAKASVADSASGSGLVIEASNLNLRLSIAEAATHALAVTARLVLEKLQKPEPDALITIQSTIPIAAGLGSGAAVSAALARALSGYLGSPLNQAELSTLVYEIEKLHHGTPSGIDNTVVCYGRPVYFVRGTPPEPLRVGRAFHMIIADTGVTSPTHVAVGGVRERWERDREKYDALFAEIGQIAEQARQAIEEGNLGRLGPLMTRNQSLLGQIGVSCNALERLIDAAEKAGAQGAKLSGGGLGGNMIALVAPESAGPIEKALKQTGAIRTIHTIVQ